MNRGASALYSAPGRMKRFYLAVVGAGAAAPTVPASAVYNQQTNAASRSAAEIPTRSGAGAYVVFYGEDYKVPEIAHIDCQVRGTPAGTPTAGLWAKVQSINLSTRAITLQVRNEGGALTDLSSANDLLVLAFDVVDSVSSI